MTNWPQLRRSDSSQAQCALTSLPLPRNADPDLVAALERGAVLAGDTRLQTQTVARWSGSERPPRRVLAGWLAPSMPERLSLPLEISEPNSTDAGWSFSYRLLQGTEGSVPWKTALRHVPLEETEYEMYQLDLSHQGLKLGLRLGLRCSGQLYWWQYIRADFLVRGPVFDILRVGGPIYNEESTIQSDLHLVLHANGVISATAHFVNHQREGVGTDTHGIPILAFDVPGAGGVQHRLTGSEQRFDLGDCQLDIGPSAGFADAGRPGSLQTEGDAVIWQPWLDQQIWGELLVEKEGVPDHRLLAGVGEGQKLTSAQRAEADRYWVTTIGDELIPRGVARSVPFCLSLSIAPPEVARYRAPAWWHAQCEALPLGRHLPTSWWALPRAVQLAEADYGTPHPRGGPFELGRSGRDSDGTLGASLLLLGHAAERAGLCDEAQLPAYWWADLAIDHVDFTCHELPKYSWQWIVQPYQRWLELVHVYWDTGDPYLLETARLAADAYYRFFWTNRPHRFVGRDALGVADLLALYDGTGEDVYLQRAREILAEGRRSYGQTDEYWPGHQSGCGPNGVARAVDFDYIPMVLARQHVQMLEAADGTLPSQEEEDAWGFVRFIAELLEERGGGEGWVQRATSLAYIVLTALADRFPEDETRWLDLLRHRNAWHDLPGAHDGGKAYCWTISALRFDAWAWGAEWRDETLHLHPTTLLVDERAPHHATVQTPRGAVDLLWEDGKVRAVGGASVPLQVHAR